MNTTLGRPEVIIDADSCPVKDEIVEIAKAFSINFLFVASYAHMSTSNPDEQWKYVDCDKEAADLYIMNYVKAKDVVVTQDIGLAATLLPKDVYVISPRGESYTEDHIRTALDLRYLSAKARKKGIYGKGPKPFTDNDRLQFIKKFTEMLSKHEGIR